MKLTKENKLDDYLFFQHLKMKIGCVLQVIHVVHAKSNLRRKSSLRGITVNYLFHLTMMTLKRM